MSVAWKLSESTFNQKLIQSAIRSNRRKICFSKNRFLGHHEIYKEIESLPGAACAKKIYDSGTATLLTQWRIQWEYLLTPNPILHDGFTRGALASRSRSSKHFGKEEQVPEVAAFREPCFQFSLSCPLLDGIHGLDLAGYKKKKCKKAAVSVRRA